MISSEVVRRIASEYGLGATRIGRRLAGGNTNHVYRLRFSGGSAVVRSLGAATPEDRVAERHAFLTFLAARGIPVAAPLRTADGRSAVVLDGAMYDLYPYVRGRRLPRGDADGIAGAGAVLAQFHRASIDYSGPMSPGGDFREAFFESAAGLPAVARTAAWAGEEAGVARKVALLETLVPQVELAVRDLDLSSLPSAIIHGDLGRGNVLVDDDRIVALVDFDHCRRDVRSLDIALSVAKLARGTYRKVFLDVSLMRAFLHAYGSFLTPTREERAVLPLFIEASVAMRAIHRLERLRDPSPHKLVERAKKFRKHVKRLRWLLETTEWRAALQEP